MRISDWSSDVCSSDLGVDMFDCVLPTRSGRNGQALTRDGTINIRNAKFAEDQEPLDADCPCPVCTTWSRAYLHHPVRSGEMLGAMLLTHDNLHFYKFGHESCRERVVQYVEFPV